MSQSVALTSPEQTALSGASTLKRYLSVVPDVVVATALINMATFEYSLASLTVDTTSAGWSSVAEGMTVYVGTSLGASDVGVYRVRKAGNSTTLYIGEVSSQDPGALPVDIRTASFANNQYITVVQRYDLFSVLPTIDASTAEIKEDFDLAPSTYNTTPPPIVNVTVNGVRNHLAAKIADSATLALTITASVTKWPTSSGSTLTYAYTYPAGFTGVSGSTTATLTATAPPGNYIVELTVSDSIGGATKRLIIINIHDDSTNPPLLISEMPTSDTRDRTGRRMSFPLYDDRMASLVDGGMVIYFEVPTWNGGDVASATRQFVGWVQRRNRQGHEALRDATIDIVGPVGILGQTYGTSQLFTAAASPATWQEVVPALSFETFVVWYMLRWRVANILRLFNYTPFSVAAAGQRLVSWKVDKGTVLQQLQTLATARSNFGANSEGELFYLRHPSLTPYGSRTTVIRDSVDASKYATVSISEDRIPHVSQVRGEGFSWDGSAAQDTPYLCDAPKTPGQGGAMETLGSQVVTDASELYQITGDYYAYRNNRYPSVNWTVQKNRDVIEPAEMPFVYVSVPDYLSPTDEAWAANVIPQSVNKRHNPDGTADMDFTGEAETHNLPADYVPIPETNDTIYSDPYDPLPIDPIPPPTTGEIIIPGAVPPVSPGATDPYVSPGLAAIYNTSTQGYAIYDIGPGAPVHTSRAIPSWFTAVSMMIHDRGEPFSRGMYLIGNNGTNSRVAYTPDGYATTPVWTMGTTISGIWTIIESVTGKPGQIVIKGGVFSAGAYADAWSVSATGMEVSRTATTITAKPAHVGATGRLIISVTGYSTGPTPPDNLARWVSPQLDAGTSWDVVSGWFVPGASYPGGESIGLYGARCIWWLDLIWPTYDAASQVTFTFSNDGGCGDTLGSVASLTATSSDYGATLNTPVALGTTSLTSGMSVGDLGVSIIAGNDAKASITNDHDGTGYRDANNGTATATYPIALLIPLWRIGSTSLSNKGINPNYFMAYAALYSGNSFVKVTGTGLTDISPSITGTKALATSALGLDSWRGKRVMLIAEVSGTRYIFYTSTTGASWSHTAMSGAVSVRARRYAKSGLEWIIALGSSTLKYSNSGGSSWSSKTVTGSAIYAEIYG